MPNQDPIQRKELQKLSSVKNAAIISTLWEKSLRTILKYFQFTLSKEGLIWQCQVTVWIWNFKKLKSSPNESAVLDLDDNLSRVHRVISVKYDLLN